MSSLFFLLFKACCFLPNISFQEYLVYKEFTKLSVSDSALQVEFFSRFEGTLLLAHLPHFIDGKAKIRKADKFTATCEFLYLRASHPVRDLCYVGPSSKILPMMTAHVHSRDDRGSKESLLPPVPI